MGSFVAVHRFLSSCGARAPERVGSVVVARRPQSTCGLCSLWHAGLVASRHVGS